MKGWDYAEICPMHLRFQYDAYSGQGLINIAQELLEGELKWEENVARHIYTCITCGACDINCKSVRDMEVLDTILALRAKCVEEGWGPMPPHKEQANLVVSHHNIYGRPHDRRFSWLSGGVHLSDKTSVAYFTGCTTAYLHPGIARDTVKILNAGGLDFKIIPEEYCCGSPLWRTGQVEAATELAEHNITTIKNHGIKTVVTSCAECYGTLRGFYPRIAKLDFEVVHIAEVIQAMLREGRLKLRRELKMKVAYHDPCLLGRLGEPYVPWHGEIKAFGYHDPPKKWRRGTQGVYDAPREVLRAIPGLELVEMTRNAENAFCCGGGGGVPLAFPDFALWTAAERLNEAESTGAAYIVSACPLCASNFRNAINAGKSTLGYHDLTGLVARAL
jgi:Fe-S oxidoreductase